MHPKKVLIKAKSVILVLYLNKSLGIDVKLVHPLKVLIKAWAVILVLYLNKSLGIDVKLVHPLKEFENPFGSASMVSPLSNSPLGILVICVSLNILKYLVIPVTPTTCVVSLINLADICVAPVPIENEIRVSESGAPDNAPLICT